MWCMRHLLRYFKQVLPLWKSASCLCYSFDLMISLPGQEDVAEEKLRLRGLVGCYALFQYLTVGIQASNAVYNQARERMEGLHCMLTADKQRNSNEDANLAGTDHSTADSRPTSKHYVSRLASDCEILAVQQASLLKYHISTSVFPLATLRQTLTSALSTWPSSAPLWSIYVQVNTNSHQSFTKNFSNSRSFTWYNDPHVASVSGGEPLP